LVQINNVVNTGIVNIDRTTPGIRKLDYTYWSSPVSGFSLVVILVLTPTFILGYQP
jgi:hypothetical protein